MISWKTFLRVGLATVAGSIYLALGHIAASSQHPPLFALIVGLIPLGAITVVAAWNSRSRHLALTLCAIGTMAIPINIDYLSAHAAWVYFIQHAGAMTLLGFTFGATLNSGDAGALCSRMASFVLGARMDPEYLRYTWKVTVAWTAFFIITGTLSVILFFFGPIEIWSLFANLLTPVFVGAMFVGEYLIRVRVLPNRSHFSIIETIQAYREFSRR